MRVLIEGGEGGGGGGAGLKFPNHAKKSPTSLFWGFIH